MPFLFKSKQEQKSTSSGTQQQTTTPVEPAEYKDLGGLLMKLFTDKLTSPSALPPGFETSGVEDINRTYDLANQRLSNELTSRGLGSSAITGAAMGRSAVDRAGQIGRFRAGLPLVEREMQMDDLKNVLAFYFARPLGQTSTGNYSNTANSVITSQPGIVPSILEGIKAVGPIRSFIQGLFS